jgi:hypothetical protein
MRALLLGAYMKKMVGSGERLNCRRKMLRSQKKVKGFLENQGFMVYLIHHTRWSKDIFGVFDGFAIKDGKVYFFQVKSNSWGNFDEFKEFCEKNKLRGLFFNVEDFKGITFKVVNEKRIFEIMDKNVVVEKQ